MTSSPHAARALPDNESDVTWHHVIVHGCSKGHMRARKWLFPGMEYDTGLPTWTAGVVTTCTGVTQGWASKRQCTNSGSH